MLKEVFAGLELVRGRKLFVRRLVLSARVEASSRVAYKVVATAFGCTADGSTNICSAGGQEATHAQQQQDPPPEQPKPTPKPPLSKTPKNILQLVLVHGLCSTQQWFDPILQVLSERLDGNASFKFGQNFEIHCLLFDLVGCGQSPVLPFWKAYSNEESISDLQQLLDKHILPQHPVVFVGHSYGPSLILKLLAGDHNDDDDNDDDDQQQQPRHKRSKNMMERYNVQGLIFLSSAIRTRSLTARDGGAPMMRLPVFLLKRLEPSMIENFVEAAVHEKNTEVQSIATWHSQENDLYAAKAYHCHQQWATEEELQCVIQQRPVSTLVLHGKDDGIVPFQAGQELANAILALTKQVQQAEHLKATSLPSRDSSSTESSCTAATAATGAAAVVNATKKTKITPAAVQETNSASLAKPENNNINDIDAANKSRPPVLMQLEMLRNSSHLILLEEPERVGKAMLAFFRDAVLPQENDDTNNDVETVAPEGCCS